MTETAIPAVPQAIAGYVRGFVRRRRWGHIARRAIIAANVLSCWFVISCLIDRWLPLPSMVRVFSLGVVSLAVLALIAPAIWRLTRSFDWIAAAEAIEWDDHRFGGRFVTVISTAMQPEQRRGSVQLRDVLEMETLNLIGVSRRRQIGFSSLRIPLVTFAIAALAVVAGTLRHRSTASVLFVRQFMPLADEAPAAAIKLHLLPGDVSHLAGEPFVVTLHADSSEDVVPILQFVLGDQPQASAVMPANADGYAFNFAALDQSMTYRVRVGVVTTPWYKVTAIAPPAAAAPLAATHPVTTRRTDDPAAAAYLKAIGKISPTTAPQ